VRTYTVAVDFDGVIHGYSLGWHDNSIYDPPVPGAFDSIRKLQETYAVVIHSARNPADIAAWVIKHSNLKVTWYEDERAIPELWQDREVVLIARRKMPAVAYIDDLGIRFTNWEQALADLAAVTA
jgi:streptomycin 6-kinase